VAVGSLFMLKTLGLILDGGYSLGRRFGSSEKLVVTTMPASPSVELRSPSVPLNSDAGSASSDKRPWMQEMFNYGEATGSIHAPKPKAKEASKEAGKDTPKDGTNNEAKNPSPNINGTPIPLDRARPTSAAERALLERLQQRRQELDARKRELDVRESLLKEAEKKIQTQNVSNKGADIKADGPSQAPESPAAARMKAIVSMYEAMKPKDAARIFDRLDGKVLLDIARLMNPRQMSEIMAQMTPEAAERLTVEMAAQGDSSEKPVNPASLPKIMGRPNGG
jgi:flagellar motility protein MotE (MotC chaperone)